MLLLTNRCQETGCSGVDEVLPNPSRIPGAIDMLFISSQGSPASIAAVLTIWVAIGARVGCWFGGSERRRALDDRWSCDATMSGFQAVGSRSVSGGLCA